MDDQPGLSDQFRTSSPWPLLVALGLALSEVGVVLGVLPVAVGGLLLLSGSVVGILRETEYVSTPWPLLSAFGAVLVLAGVGLYVGSGGPLSETVPFADLNGVAKRGLAIAIAGVFALVGAAYGRISIGPGPSARR